MPRRALPPPPSEDPPPPPSVNNQLDQNVDLAVALQEKRRPNSLGGFQAEQQARQEAQEGAAKDTVDALDAGTCWLHAGLVENAAASVAAQGWLLPCLAVPDVCADVRVALQLAAAEGVHLRRAPPAANVGGSDGAEQRAWHCSGRSRRGDVSSAAARDEVRLQEQRVGKEGGTCCIWAWRSPLGIPVEEATERLVMPMVSEPSLSQRPSSPHDGIRSEIMSFSVSPLKLPRHCAKASTTCGRQLTPGLCQADAVPDHEWETLSAVSSETRSGSSISDSLLYSSSSESLLSLSDVDSDDDEEVLFRPCLHIEAE